MIIQALLIALLFFLMAYAISQHRRSRPVAFVILISCAVGIVFVVAPEVSTEIANHLGVGRGADLVFYVLSLVTLTAIFNLHLRARAASEVVTSLARAMAITNAERPKQ
jgi:hypothetical protein